MLSPVDKVVQSRGLRVLFLKALDELKNATGVLDHQDCYSFSSALKGRPSSGYHRPKAVSFKKKKKKHMTHPIKSCF